MSRDGQDLLFVLLTNQQMSDLWMRLHLINNAAATSQALLCWEGLCWWRGKQAMKLNHPVWFMCCFFYSS